MANYKPKEKNLKALRLITIYDNHLNNNIFKKDYIDNVAKCYFDELYSKVLTACFKKDKAKKAAKKYAENNVEKIKNYSNNYIKKRILYDPLFRMQHNIRGSIRNALARKGYTKKTNTYKILGCEYDFFASFLDLNNYNEDSHLDHVVPISLASTEKEVLLLNHYSNFQLLTSKENFAKGNRYIKNDNLQRVLDNHPQQKIIQEIVNRSNIEIKKPFN